MPLSSSFFGNSSRIFRNLLLVIPVIFSLSFSKTDLYVFLLSGQSNMSGAGLTKDLSADLNKTVDSVIIYLASEGDNSKLGKWLTLGPGFGNPALAMISNPGLAFGPELSFGKTLADSLPGKKFAFIKDAVSGTYLNKSSGWRPPSSGGTAGTLYTNMMKHIDNALNAIDTSKYILRMAGFVWFQGEFDAQNTTDANAYEDNLTNLIKDIRNKLNTDDLPVIIPLIDVQSMWTYSSKVRAADIAVRNKLENVDTLDTKGFETDGIHYKAKGQVKIGQIAAQRWLNMQYFDSTVKVITFPRNTQRIEPFSFNGAVLFDLTGRKITSESAFFNSKAKMSSILHITKYKDKYQKILHVTVN